MDMDEDQAINRKRRQKGNESIKKERKRLRTSGEEHTSRKIDVVAAKKHPHPLAQCKCKYICKKLSAEHKESLYTDFYKVDKGKQGTFLLSLLQIGAVQRRRHGKYDDPGDSRRQATIFYTVPDGNGEHSQVCRGTFGDIFAISHKQIQVLVEKKKSGENVYEDKRGKHHKARKFTPDIREQVNAHVRTFPVEENHYSRQKSQKEFLSPDLNVNRMFKAFKDKFPDSQVTYRYYSDTFHKDFPNLRFGRPRSDTCSTCDLLNAKIKTSQQEKQKYRAELELHQRKAQAAMDGLKRDIIDSQKITSDRCMISIDLQQVMFVPTLTHSQMFYSRQLSCFNLCVHIGDTDDSYMCMWNEMVSGRGGNEIASCLLKVIQDNPFRKKKLVIWSDNCIGQNKNRMMIFTLMFLVSNNVFEEIDHKFLVSGHSYLPCDRDFALIEKRKRVSKSYVPADLESLVTSSRHKNPFKVIPMAKKDFKDMQAAADEFIKTTNLKISKVSWLRISSGNPTRIKVKKTFNEAEEWQEVSVIKKSKKRDDIIEMELPILDCKNRITAEKKKDLKDMLPYLPEGHRAFYEQICSE